MLDVRSWVLWGLLACATGCGARTIADDYRRDGGGTPDALPDAQPDAPPDTGTVCSPGTVLCAGRCVDPTSDPANCGGCGVSCGTSGVCVGGVCTGVACAGGLTWCSGSCVNTASSTAHCGRCNNPCAPGLDCVSGVCRLGTCAMGLLRCSGACVNPNFDGQNCGACNRVCPGGTQCRAGACVSVCGTGGLFCGGVCVDSLTDPSNCGACGRVCGSGTRCNRGSCDALCGAGQVLCSSGCANVLTDPMNCGRCGAACGIGSTCVLGGCAPVTMPSSTFRIEGLSALNCRSTEHAMVTGDDRGGIAIGSGQVFYTGDMTTAGFDLDTLLPRTTSGATLDGLFGETSFGLAFTLASNRTPLNMSTSIVDAVLGLGPDGRPGSTVTPLSDVIFLTRSSGFDSSVGIFGGPLRAIVTQGARAWIIDGGPSTARPTVTALVIQPVLTHTPCESWAFWGVAELFEGAPWVAYVRDSTTIVRQNLFTGAVRTVATFSNLSDMCSFTVSPSRNRWYFHHEGTSQFRSGDETIGYCDASFTTSP